MASSAKTPNIFSDYIVCTTRHGILSNPLTFTTHRHIDLKPNVSTNLHITCEDFLKGLQLLKHNRNESYAMCYHDLNKTFPEFKKIFEELHDVYMTMVEEIPATEPEKTKGYIKVYEFMSRVIVLRVLVDGIISMIDKEQSSSDSIIELVQKIQQKHEIKFLSTIQIYISTFNSKYKKSLPLFKKPNSHSSLGSTRSIALKGDSKLIPGMDNIITGFGYEEKEQFSRIFLCESRRKVCFLPISLDAITSFFQSLYKSHTIQFRIKFDLQNKVEAFFKCPNSSFHPTKPELCCDKEINFTPLTISKLHIIDSEGKKRIFNKKENDEYKICYKKLLLQYKDTAFPEKYKIVFCLNSECAGSLGYCVNKRRVSAPCYVCHDVFCTVCNVSGLHANDGSECEAMIQARRDELGEAFDANTSICPNKKCQMFISRIDGCDKMTCETSIGGCNTTFCFKCKRKTALQQTDIDCIKTKFFEITGLKINFVSEKAFLYIHPDKKDEDDDCVNNIIGQTIFRPLSNMLEWVYTDIRYDTAHKELLHEHHVSLVYNMMLEAVEINSIM